MLIVYVHEQGLPTVHSRAFVQGFNSFNVSSVEPNSCLLLNMCAAYAEVGLLASRNIFAVPRGNPCETLFGEQGNHVPQKVCG